MKKERCSECDKLFPRDRLIRWIDAADTLSPKFCKKCYMRVLDNYEEGFDIGDRSDDGEGY